MKQKPQRTNVSRPLGSDPALENALSPDPFLVDASPTKRFFIDVITRDITLPRAILDLVDNCVDGAIRLKGTPVPTLKTTKQESRQYEGLWIRVTCRPESFSVEDNCGGIPLDVARHYAFKFGHDETKEESRHRPTGGSHIGLFGIGMKRALFKLGTGFKIESTTNGSHFVLSDTTANWVSRPEWNFRLASFEENGSANAEAGTTVAISPLHPVVAREFGRSSFPTNLANDMSNGLQEFVRRGLEVTVQSESASLIVERIEPQLYVGNQVAPFAMHEEVKLGKGPPVIIRMYVGIGRPSLPRAGWYVFCNGRLVVGPEQSSLTGWNAREPARIPRYHKQFDRFYGYVYFDSEDSKKLPWNTTKTGLDQDSSLFQSIRDRMILAMRPVIDMLNAARHEVKHHSLARPVNKAIAGASLKSLPGLPISKTFLWPTEGTDAQSSPPRELFVSFSRPRKELDLACKYFHVDNTDRAAELAFEYWYKETK